jgi:hypothetical protein
MLYKFQSDVTGDLIMLEPNGQQMLTIIGKDPGATGIILPGQMAAAILAIQAAVQAESAAGQDSIDEAPKPARERISLRQRAVPFIAMLQACQKAGKPVVWGV